MVSKGIGQNFCTCSVLPICLLYILWSKDLGQTGAKRVKATSSYSWKMPHNYTIVSYFLLLVLKNHDIMFYFSKLQSIKITHAKGHVSFLSSLKHSNVLARSYLYFLHVLLCEPKFWLKNDHKFKLFMG